MGSLTPGLQDSCKPRSQDQCTSLEQLSYQWSVLAKNFPCSFCYMLVVIFCVKRFLTCRNSSADPLIFSCVHRSPEILLKSS